MKVTKEELKQRQAWTLPQKIDHSLGTIDQFIARMNGKVYVSFSGGKDSTVLMHLCEIIKPDIKCVFVNTGCEYIDIIRFVEKMKASHNIEIIRPKLTPRQVWEKYGFPLISKEIADKIHRVRINPNSITAQIAMSEDNMFGIKDKYRYLCDKNLTKYETNSRCCNKLKKEPCHHFERVTGLRPIIGTMASESRLREASYLKVGNCNSFTEGREKSNPLSIWNEQDIWQFINENHIEIAEIYKKGVCRTGCVSCGFGCQIKGDNRFQTLYNLYPKYYEMTLNFTNNGVTYREALRQLLQTNNLRLPDEK